ncbi:MAG TPA: TonB-dependent receptor [Pyrinomonadaceae bacterium]|jgi:hypothetical protein
MLSTGKGISAIRLLLIVVAAVAAIFLISSTALAQTDFGDIGGVIVDTGDPATPIPNMTVTLTRLSTQQKRTTVTDKNGRYAFSALEADSYEVSAGGSASEVRVFLGQSLTLNLSVSTTAAFTQPTPTPSPGTRQTRLRRPLPEPTPVFAPLKDGKGRVGITLTQSDIENSTGRGIEGQRLLMQAPGATTNSEGGVSFNAVPDDQTVFRVNGVDTGPLIFIPSTSFQDNRSFALGLNSKFPTRFSSFKELSVDTNNYPAYLGTGTGGQISGDIKKGNADNINDSKLAGDIYGFFSDDSLNARNFFDLNREPSFSYAQYGFQLGGPLYKKKVFFYANYEGVRTRSGAQIFEAVPSAAAQTRAVQAVAPLLVTFNQGGGSIVQGASSDPNYDIVELNSTNITNRNGVAAHFNFIKRNNEANFIYIREQAFENFPEGVTGRRQIKRDIRQTGILRFKSTFESGITNEFIFGVNSSPVRLGGRLSTAGGPDISASTILIRGDVAQSGIAGQPAKLGIAAPGSLLRKNSFFVGRDLLFTPYNFQFNDNVVWSRGTNHIYTFGGGIRLLRTYMDVQPGITYTFSNLEDFLQAKPASVQYLGDLGSPSPTGATPSGERKAEQEYYILYAQHQWKIRGNIFLTYGLRYEYYSVLRESQDRAIIFDIESGRLLPPQTPFYRPSKANFAPRVAIAWAPDIACPTLDPKKCKFAESRMVLSASFGVYLGPSPFLDQAKPIESDRIISVTQPGGVFPSNPNTLAADFLNNQDNRQFQPLAIARDYTNVERLYKYDVSLKYPLFKDFSVLATYSGNQGRNLLLRNFGNRIEQVLTNADPTKSAVVIREFDIVNGDTILKPFGEIDYRTSGGSSIYNSFQFTLRGKYRSLQLVDAQYTLASSRDNTNGGAKTITTGNPFDYDYDWGYGPDDVRHKLSVKVLYSLPLGRNRKFLSDADGLLQRIIGNWTAVAFADFQSGKPIDLSITRPDIVYIDATGNIFSTPAPGRQAVLNTPGGGASIGVRRPDLIPGVNPYLRNGLSYLNPKAFAIPAPGTFGNLRRGELRGPGLKAIDLVIRKQFFKGDNVPAAEFRFEVTNLFNWVNFNRPSATLPNVLGTDAARNELQPGKPFTSASAGTFGLLNRTFKRDQELSSSRQLKFAFVINIGGGR